LLDSKRREFIVLVGGGGLLLAAKVRRARGQQPSMPVLGLLGATTAHGYAAQLVLVASPLIVGTLVRLRSRSCIIDGEAVAGHENGVASFDRSLPFALIQRKFMSQERLQRRLAAILFADVVGYSRLTGQDEVGTWRRLQSVLREAVRPHLKAHGWADHQDQRRWHFGGICECGGGSG
jgi:hypothetical protein